MASGRSGVQPRQMKYAIGIAAVMVGGVVFALVSEVAGIVIWVLSFLALPWTPSPSFGAQAADGED
jgi:cytochrome b subunit of formate dehydrogenase